MTRRNRRRRPTTDAISSALDGGARVLVVPLAPVIHSTSWKWNSQKFGEVLATYSPSAFRLHAHARLVSLPAGVRSSGESSLPLNSLCPGQHPLATSSSSGADQPQDTQQSRSALAVSVREAYSCQDPTSPTIRIPRPAPRPNLGPTTSLRSSLAAPL